MSDLHFDLSAAIARAPSRSLAFFKGMSCPARSFMMVVGRVAAGRPLRPRDPATYYHPCSMGKGVFTGELIRIRRSSTLDYHYEPAAERPEQAFRARVCKRSIFHLSDPYTRNGCAGKVCWSDWHGFGLFL